MIGARPGLSAIVALKRRETPGCGVFGNCNPDQLDCLEHRENRPTESPGPRSSHGPDCEHDACPSGTKKGDCVDHWVCRQDPAGSLGLGIGTHGSLSFAGSRVAECYHTSPSYASSVAASPAAVAKTGRHWLTHPPRMLVLPNVMGMSRRAYPLRSVYLLTLRLMPFLGSRGRRHLALVVARVGGDYCDEKRRESDQEQRSCQVDLLGRVVHPRHVAEQPYRDAETEGQKRDGEQRRPKPAE